MSAAGSRRWPRARPDGRCCWPRRRGWRSPALVDEVLAALPALKPARAYAVADALGARRDGVRNFMDLLRAGIAAAVRDVVRGRGRRGAVAAGGAASP